MVTCMGRYNENKHHHRSCHASVFSGNAGHAGSGLWWCAPCPAFLAIPLSFSDVLHHLQTSRRHTFYVRTDRLPASRTHLVSNTRAPCQPAAPLYAVWPPSLGPRPPSFVGEHAMLTESCLILATDSIDRSRPLVTNPF